MSQALPDLRFPKCISCVLATLTTFCVDNIDKIESQHSIVPGLRDRFVNYTAICIILYQINRKGSCSDASTSFGAG